jgi:threonine/homoserine/homoserine lactone efflux protein
MGGAIGGMLPFAVGIALSPMPIVAVVLFLVTERARANALSFLVGWIVGIAGVGTIALAIAGPTDPGSTSSPAAWVSWLQLALGVVLLHAAVRRWRARPAHDEEPALPKWMGTIEGFGPAKAFVGGLALSALNPKNLVLLLAGAAAVAQADASGAEQAAAWAIFTVLATVGVAVPVVLYFAMGDRAAAVLDRLKTWMARNNATIIAVICVLFAAKLFGDAISGFTA